MQGLRIQCPGCKKVYHETTEKYDPDVRPNGAMVRLLEPWKGWGWAAFDAEGQAVSTTLCSEMLCPGCTAPLAPGGRLTILKSEFEEPVPPPDTIVIIEEAHVISDRVMRKLQTAPGLEEGVGVLGSAPDGSGITSPFTSDGNQPPVSGDSKEKTTQEPQPPASKKKKKANTAKKRGEK